MQTEKPQYKNVSQRNVTILTWWGNSFFLFFSGLGFSVWCSKSGGEVPFLPLVLRDLDLSGLYGAKNRYCYCYYDGSYWWILAAATAAVAAAVAVVVTVLIDRSISIHGRCYYHYHHPSIVVIVINVTFLSSFFPLLFILILISRQARRTDIIIGSDGNVWWSYIKWTVTVFGAVIGGQPVI